MTALTELRDEAALHPDGSRAKRLLTWAEIHFSDSADRIFELEDEAMQASNENAKLRAALNVLYDVLSVAGSFAKGEAFSLHPDTFSRDFSPYINLMGGHGDPDYMKGQLSARHIDTRESPKRGGKKKACNDG